MSLRRFAVPVLALSFSTVSQAHAGCAEMPDACQVPMGEYHAAVPDTPKEGNPAVLFIHGFGGSGANVLRNTGMVNKILDRGYTIIAPTGMPRTEGRGASWSFHPQRAEKRDESQFFDQVVQNAADRFDVNPDNVLMAGFSIGGSMTSYIACENPGQFSAYAPVAGGLWRPHPAGCEGPVKLFHTHGWRDGTVPLEGRVLRNGALRQGDVFHGMQIWRDTNACDNMKADEMTTDGDFWRRKWTSCAPDSALEFALFPGGHSVPQGWADMALDWYETLSIQATDVQTQ